MGSNHETNSELSVAQDPKLYEFDEFKDFFELQLRRKNTKEDGRKISTLNELAKKLGYNSPSLLSMIAKGSRLPSISLLEALFNEWDIDPVGRETIRLKVEIERRRKKGQTTHQLLTELNKLAKDKNYHSLDITQADSIRDWYMMVLKIMADQPDFTEDAEELSRRLRRKVTADEVQRGLQTLIQLGLLERKLDNGALQSTTGSTETTHEIPSTAIQEHHRGMLNRAIEAIAEQPVQARHFNALTISFIPQHLPEVKQRILDFMKRINSEYGHNQSPHIYQLNVQFFEHTNIDQQEKP